MCSTFLAYPVASARSVPLTCRLGIMNSYPPELLTQLAPVMFVAGLDVATPPESTPPSSPQPPTPSGGRPQQDPFTVLTLRLRDALVAQRKVAIWQPEKSKTFQVILVEKVRSMPVHAPRKYLLTYRTGSTLPAAQTCPSG